MTFQLPSLYRCGRCGEEKTRENYYARGEGVQPWCKWCQQAYRRQNRERVRGWNLKYKGYGITLEQRDELERKQHGLCAICQQPPHPKKPLHVDHCHKTGRVRGLLCNQCNRLLGLAQDDRERLWAASLYLQANEPITEREMARA